MSESAYFLLATELTITDTGRTPVQVVKLVRRATGMTLVDTKRLVDHPPFAVRVPIGTEALMTAALQAAGATVRLPAVPPPDTIGRARDDYATDSIELEEFERRVDTILGITRPQGDPCARSSSSPSPAPRSEG